MIALQLGINMSAIPATDDDGFLLNLADWNPQIAEALAQQEGITLNSEHWEMIEIFRSFYEDFGLSPAMRPLVKYTAAKLGKDKGNSIYLLSLFPPSAAKIGSKIAGLPRPTNCL
jgi:tRNA 2-thiouridine synthesizing protein E